MSIINTDYTSKLVQQLEQAAKWGEIELTCITQMLMSLRWVTSPQEMIRLAQTFELSSEETSWNLLCLAEKVSVFYRSRGIEATCQAIPALNAPTAMVEQLTQFQKDVCSLTNGVLHSQKLNGYFILRTLLLADAAHLLTAERRAKKSTSIVHKGQTSAIESLEYLFVHLNTLFIFIDRHLNSDPIDLNAALSERCSDLEDDLAMLEVYKKALAAESDKLTTRSRTTRLENMSHIMKKLREVLQNPICFLPILLAPVQSQALVGEASKSEKHIDLRATEWLEAQLEVCEFQSEAFFRLLNNESILKSEAETLQSTCNGAFQKARQINGQLLRGVKELHAFLVLPGDTQRKRLDQLKGTLDKCARCAQSLSELETDEVKIAKKALVLAKGKSSIVQQLVVFPNHYHHTLLKDLIRGLNDIKGQMISIHEQLPSLLPEEFKNIDSPYINCLDLLDLRRRREFAKLRKKAFPTTDDPATQKLFVELHKFLQSLLIKSSLQFLALRTYYSCPLDDQDNSFDTASQLYQLSQDISKAAVDSKIVKIFANPQTEPCVKYLESLDALIQKLCTLRHWHGMMKASPVAARQQSDPTVRKFFHELYAILFQTLIETDGDFLYKPLEDLVDNSWMKSQGDLNSLFKAALVDIKAFFKEFQLELKQRQIPPLKKFEPLAYETVLFIAETMERMDQKFDALFQALIDHLQSYPEQEESVDSSVTVLKVTKEAWDPLILDSSNGLVRYLQGAHCMAESKTAAPKQKIVRKAPAKGHVEPKTVPQPMPVILTAAPTSGPVPETLPGLLQAVEQRCAKLAGHYMGFSTHTHDTGLQFANQFSAMNARNLLDTAASLKELVANVHKYGAHPGFTAEIYLRLAIFLEQALKLKAAGSGVSISEDDPTPLLLLKSGRECLWQTHSPFRIYKTLNLDLLSAEQEELLKKLARVIAISSRYPVTGNDALLRHIQQLFASDEESCSESQKVLQMGLSAALHLLNAVPADQSVEPFKIPLEVKQIEDCLTSYPKTEIKVQPLQSILDKLKNLQLIRLAPQNRVISGDAASSQRSGTIQASLSDLSLVLRLCEDLLQMPEDPAICLTLGKSILRQEAVGLELALLILLSHLPVVSPENPDLHYLWDASPPRRFSHRIDQFAKQLAQKNDNPISKRAQELVDYLRTSYRYPSEKESLPILGKLYTLSLLWERLLAGTLSETEGKTIDRIMNISNPDDRGTRLASHIQETIQYGIKQPFYQTMALVADLLERYEKNIR
ncbi:MAG: hypothetical protein LLG04_02740 [Parachlamydia sp.]|nr:hypothetical protein [Parachlamydia sp.]